MKEKIEFSDKLIAHLIEWMVHYSMYDYKKEESIDKTPTQCFETECWNVNYTLALDECYHILTAVKVIEPTIDIKYKTDRATCKFSEVKKIAFKNLQQLGGLGSGMKRQWVFPAFIRIATQSTIILTSSETEYFYIDEYWENMFGCFIQHKLVRRIESRYFWTNKARPYLEEFGVWKVQPANDVFSANEKLLMSLTASVKNILYHLAVEDKKIEAVKLLTDTTGESMGVCKSFLEQHMFPTIWGEKPIDYQLKHWKFYS